MVSDDSFQVIKKFILQCISLIGFDEIHATLIFTTYFRSIFFHYISCYRKKYILFLVYCCFVILCLGKLSSLISTLHSGRCTLKATLEINLFLDELLFLTIFGFSNVLLEHENSSISFGYCFCLVGLKNNYFSSQDSLFLSNGLFRAVKNDPFV